MFVLCLRQDYQEKRKAFRQIFDVHKVEIEEKEKYWNEMLTVSFSCIELLKVNWYTSVFSSLYNVS